jgi:hypothetical protein
MYNIMFSVKHNKIKGSNNLLYRNHFFFNHTAVNGFNKIHVLLIPYICSLFSVSFEGQTTQWPKERGDKQRSTKHYIEN